MWQNQRRLHTLKINFSKSVVFPGMLKIIFIHSGIFQYLFTTVVVFPQCQSYSEKSLTLLCCGDFQTCSAMFSKLAVSVFKKPVKYLCSMKLLYTVKSTLCISPHHVTETMFDHIIAVLWSDWTLHNLPQTRWHAARPEPSVVLRESGNYSMEGKKYQHSHVKMQDPVARALRVQISALPEQHL